MIGGLEKQIKEIKKGNFFDIITIGHGDWIPSDLVLYTLIYIQGCAANSYDENRLKPFEYSCTLWVKIFTIINSFYPKSSYET